ncbi:MAG: hypothetical protein C4K47_06940 [Candidatus Thorarchaeota archaeon]|nr:MAG: hypothetical protein C4K47_06940 [Candidatus Thorarchaeota archaeon]
MSQRTKDGSPFKAEMSRLRVDQRLLILFLSLVIISSALVAASYFALDAGPIDQLAGTLLAGITLSFFVCGLSGNSSCRRILCHAHRQGSGRAHRHGRGRDYGDFART